MLQDTFGSRLWQEHCADRVVDSIFKLNEDAMETLEAHYLYMLLMTKSSSSL